MDNNKITGFSCDHLDIGAKDGHNSIIEKEFKYTTLAGIVIIVTEGTKTDGASIPRIIWNILPPFGDYWMATVLHDYLYNYSDYSRKFCDDILLEAMKRLGVNIFKAYTIYSQVRLWGWHAFAVDRKRRAK